MMCRGCPRNDGHDNPENCYAQFPSRMFCRRRHRGGGRRDSRWNRPEAGFRGVFHIGCSTRPVRANRRAEELTSG